MEPQDRDMLGRIDERTKDMAKWCERHEKQDREDFKEVHSRINRLSRTVYIGSGALGLMVAAVAAWFKGIFSGA